MKIVMYCSLMGLLGIHATCNKRIDCKQTTYYFEGYYKASPTPDSIRVNDTVWLKLVLPTILKDVMTGEMVDYSGAENLGPSIQFGKFTGGDVLNPGGVPAANDFETKLIWGSSISSDKPDQVKGFRCLEENGMYVFQIGIIPKRMGTFSISAGDLSGVYRKSNKCDKAGFNLTFKDTDQHLYLYEQNRPGYTPSEYERTHMYCFKVY